VLHCCSKSAKTAFQLTSRIEFASDKSSHNLEHTATPAPAPAVAVRLSLLLRLFAI
jgi:hypothetical protein